jgi:DNA polymerase-3 subunit gamma/tau
MVAAPIPAAPVPVTPKAEVRGTTVAVPQAQPRVLPESRPAAAPEPMPGVVELAAAAPSAAGSLEQTQQRVIEALRSAKQSSAADALEDSVWTFADGEVRVQTELSKVMLPVVLNADAEKILRSTAREAGVPRLTLLPGIPSATASKPPKPARTGSVEAKALEHPMVQQAQKLFDAEIQSVIDLRDRE